MVSWANCYHLPRHRLRGQCRDVYGLVALVDNLRLTDISTPYRANAQIVPSEFPDVLVVVGLPGIRHLILVAFHESHLYSKAVQRCRLEGPGEMETQTTYTQARANLAKLCDQVAQNRDIVIIRRRGGNDVALVAADELSSILETLHLLRSPRNADRLLSALRDAKAGKGKARSVRSLRREVGLGAE